jgi:hypothetical protein
MCGGCSTRVVTRAEFLDWVAQAEDLERRRDEAVERDEWRRQEAAHAIRRRDDTIVRLREAIYEAYRNLRSDHPAAKILAHEINRHARTEGENDAV